MLGQSIRKNSAILAAFAAVTAGLIAFIYQSTHARIAEAERRAAQRALFEIVPESRHDNDLLNDLITLPQAQAARLSAGPVHVARWQQVPVAFIFPTIARDGYSGDIHLIVGVNVDGTVSGVRVVNHRETPGLGDKIELQKSGWILGFDGRSLEDPGADRWRVKKDGGDFDQFAGATITPRAVVKQVQAVLGFVQEHRDQLLGQAQAASPIQ